MNKRTQMIITLTGVGAVLLGAGACNQAPPEDTGPAPLPPKRMAKGGAPGQGKMTPGSPGLKNKANGAANPAAQGKGPKGGGQRVAAGGQMPGGHPAAGTPGRDPFAPHGPAAAGRPGPGAPVAGPPPYVAYGGRRKDPFLIDWKLPVPPPYIFDEIEPIRLASDYVPTPPSKPYEIREEPELRVSGILTGDGVYAILERPDGVNVVKPGSTIDIDVAGQTKRTYRVVSITKDKVKLRSQVGNVIYTQDVPLSDVAVGTPARGGAGGFPGSSGPAFGPGGSPGSGGPGFPGAPRGGGGGRRGGGAGSGRAD